MSIFALPDHRTGSDINIEQVVTLMSRGCEERQVLVYRDPQVNLYVRDVEASVRFYAEMFGFRESFRTPASGPPEHVEVRLGSFILGLGAISAALNTHGVATGGESRRAGVCLWTDDIDQAYAQLVERGVESLSGPHDFLDGCLRGAWVADPDGNPIEIVSERVPASVS